MKRVVGDLEADGLLDTATRIWCGVFDDIDTGERYVFTPDNIDQMPAFLDTVDALVMHNGIQYDVPLLKKVLDYDYKGSVIDTLVMSRLQRPDRRIPNGCKAGPHSVEAWGMRFGVHKPEHEDWSRYSDEMLHRCGEDVRIQSMILSALLDEGGPQWKAAHKMSFKLFDILGKQERYGWLIDIEYMAKCQRQLTHWMRKIRLATYERMPMRCIRAKKTGGVYAYYKAPFKKDGGLKSFVLTYANNIDDNWGRFIAGPFSCVEFRRVDISKAEEVKAFLLDSGWVPEQWNTNDVGERTSPKLSHTESFEGVEGQLGRLVSRWYQCRHRRSQITGWFKRLRDDGRIGQVISGIAATGRLTHQNIVNVPGDESFYGRQMRRCFVAKQGYKIVGVDSAGCQNRMLAGRVGDDNYTRILLDGKKEDRTSIHYVNQAAIRDVAGFEPSYKVCKNLNYAFLFGATDRKLGTTALVSEEMGSRIREALYSVAPGLERLVDSLKSEWRKTAVKRGWKYQNGTVIGLDGRPVKIESEHCLLVYMLQSDEAIMMQYALCLLYDRLCEKGWVHGREYGFVANVHDEIQAEVREDLAQEYAETACQAIVDAGALLKIQCPHLGEADIGDNWYETH